MGISLHSHTMYSEESLQMVSRYTARVPYLGHVMFKLEAQKERVLEHWAERPNPDQGRAQNIDSHRAV